MSTYFISGIDTDIGKTVAVGAMARFLLQRGRRVITAKLVQTGNDGFSEDLDRHREMMGVGRFPEDEAGLTAPEIFRFPASPHLAARLEGREVSVGRIIAAVAELERRYETVLLEGAGGLAVPLTEELLSIDLAARQGWRPILVTSGRLGSLSQTILALEALKNRGMVPAGVVYNLHPAADPVITEDTRRMIRKTLKGMGFPDVAADLPHLGANADFSLLFPEAK